jgi:uncharacterized membrane protein
MLTLSHSAGQAPALPHAHHTIIMHVELLILRLVHILGGIFWVGTVLFTTVFLVPALAASGANVGQIMGALQRRGFMIVMPIIGLLTIGSGLRLMYIVSDGNDAFFRTPMGRALSIGGASAILAFLIGVIFVRSTAVRSARLGAELATASDAQRGGIMQELATLRRRGTVAGLIVVALLVVAASAMAMARYLN